MIASKVTINRDTRAKLLTPILSPDKKRRLREQFIVDCIRNSANGRCTKQQLVAAAGYDPTTGTREYFRGISLVNSMIKRQIISHDNQSRIYKIWTVRQDVKIKTPKVTPTPVEVAAEIVIQPKQYKELTSVELVAMAKEFAWQKNSDSLREFIEYAANAIK